MRLHAKSSGHSLKKSYQRQRKRSRVGVNGDRCTIWAWIWRRRGRSSRGRAETHSMMSSTDAHLVLWNRSVFICVIYECIFILCTRLFYFYWFCLGIGHYMLFILCDWLTAWLSDYGGSLSLFMQPVANENSELAVYSYSFRYKCMYINLLLRFAKPFKKTTMTRV